MIMPLDLKKPLQTRKGNEVKIFMENSGNKYYPIMGAIFEEGEWFPRGWDKNGRLYEDSLHDQDLINVPEKPKAELPQLKKISGPPTKPGWYWTQWHPGGDPKILEFIHSVAIGRVGTVCTINPDWDIDWHAGPIPTPELKKPKKHRVWVNFYHSPIIRNHFESWSYLTKEEARRNAAQGIISSLEVEFEEGEGL